MQPKSKLTWRDYVFAEIAGINILTLAICVALVIIVTGATILMRVL